MKGIPHWFPKQNLKHLKWIVLQLKQDDERLDSYFDKEITNEWRFK